MEGKVVEAGPVIAVSTESRVAALSLSRARVSQMLWGEGKGFVGMTWGTGVGWIPYRNWLM